MQAAFISLKNCIIVFLLAVLSKGCNNTATESSKRNYVGFEPIAVIKTDRIKKTAMPRPATAFQYKWQLEHFLNDSGTVYFAFRNKISSSSLDFDKYDYVFSSSREIDSLYHSKVFTQKYDGCTKKDKTALEKVYKPYINDSLLFIYRLKDKNKYRDPCG